MSGRAGKPAPGGRGDSMPRRLARTAGFFLLLLAAYGLIPPLAALLSAGG